MNDTATHANWPVHRQVSEYVWGSRSFHRSHLICAPLEIILENVFHFSEQDVRDLVLLY